MAEGESTEICHCVGVRRDTLVRAIVGGCRSIDDLRRATGACTGCSTCWPDLARLLAQHAPAPTASGPRADAERPDV